MSAYLLDPVTMDYILTWLGERRRDNLSSVRVDTEAPDLAALDATNPQAVIRQTWPDGEQVVRIEVRNLGLQSIGSLLFEENVRSLFYRYPDDTEATVPGPIENTRCFDYTFKRIQGLEPRPAWVIRSLDCWEYQSCECPDFRSTVAFAVYTMIRELAIRKMVGEDAPWGVTERELTTERAKIATRRAEIYAQVRAGA